MDKVLLPTSFQRGKAWCFGSQTPLCFLLGHGKPFALGPRRQAVSSPWNMMQGSLCSDKCISPRKFTSTLSILEHKVDEATSSLSFPCQVSILFPGEKNNVWPSFQALPSSNLQNSSGFDEGILVPQLCSIPSVKPWRRKVWSTSNTCVKGELLT